MIAEREAHRAKKKKEEQLYTGVQEMGKKNKDPFTALSLHSHAPLQPRPIIDNGMKSATG